MNQANAKPTVEIIQPREFLLGRRGETRNSCLIKGALYFVKSAQSVGCKIVDQSSSGAKIAMPDGVLTTQGDIWLIDLENHVAKIGSAAWANPTAFGLRFRYIQSLKPNMPRPPKVPQIVFGLWLAHVAPPAAQGDGFFLD